MPDLDNFRSKGNKIMIGHSSSPDGNHYEIIQKLMQLILPYPILLPLSYGDKKYGNIIKSEAKKNLLMLRY